MPDPPSRNGGNKGRRIRGAEDAAEVTWIGSGDGGIGRGGVGAAAGACWGEVSSSSPPPEEEEEEVSTVGFRSDEAHGNGEETRKGKGSGSGSGSIERKKSGFAWS